MKLSIGIVGLPNVGKSTLFHFLTNNEVHIANYPFATIDPNIGIVEVPDERIEKLAEVVKTEKKIPAVVEFYDIAGLVKGANKGEGLGNKFLQHIRETNAIVQVVRCFKKDEITHVENDVNPVRDISTINTELILKDLETVQKRLDKARKESKTGDKKKEEEVKILELVEVELNKEKLANTLSVEILDNPVISEMNLLTAKKQMYLLNGRREELDSNLLAFLDSIGSAYVVVDLSEKPDLSELIKKSYSILDLISFFTAGEQEVRAWTIKNGAKAPEASGTIHSDFEDKFIRAETVFWESLVESGGWAEARKKGLVRIEGKDYIVKDGDVLIVRHG